MGRRRFGPECKPASGLDGGRGLGGVCVQVALDYPELNFYEREWTAETSIEVSEIT